MSIIKVPGSDFGTRINYQHIGPAVTVWIGIGLAYGIPTGHNPPFVYAMIQVPIPAALIWTGYYTDVAGVIPMDAEDGKLIDVTRFISIAQPIVGQQPGNDYGINGWDDEVYAIEQTKFQTLVIDPTIGYF